MNKRLAFGMVPVAVAALAATTAAVLAASGGVSAAAAADGPVTAVAGDVHLTGGVERTGQLAVTVYNGTDFQDEGRFLVQMPQTARLAPGQQCVLYDWNLSQWLCEGTRLEGRQSHTTTLTVRSLVGDPNFHGHDVGSVQGMANSNDKSKPQGFTIFWSAAQK